MRDTPPGIERKFRKMLLKRSGEERLKMGCSMHAAAQALARASIFEQHPGARPADLKRLLFLHFYATDFEPEERKRIASALARSGGDGRGRKLSVGPDFAVVKSAGVREGAAPYGKKRKSKRRR